MTGIALIASEFPVSLLEPVIDRLHDRGGVPEVRFENRHDPPLLPVRWNGALRLMQWGSRDRRSSLPHGGWLTRHQMEAGMLTDVDEVVIPANYGHQHGVWFLVEEGVRGIVIPDAGAVYVLMEPSTNYYRNMTGQSQLMPVLVNQVI
ncbi:MAG: hypothetical protein U0791_18505 [Gemmataceae bacterium]